MDFMDLTITSIETISAFDIATGDFMFTLDELQNATLAQTQDKQDITGKQGRKLSSLKRNKAVTVSGTNGLVSGGLLELQTGGKFDSRKTTVMWADYQKVSGNAATTAYKAVGTTGDEISKILVKNSDGTISSKFVQDAAVGEGKFTYDPDTKAIAFNEGAIKDGTEIVIYYMRQINATVLENMSDVYSGKAELYINALGEDKCANVYRLQFHIPKADFNGEFSFEMGENQSVHSFEAEALAGACGAGGTLWTFAVFGAESEDVA